MPSIDQNRNRWATFPWSKMGDEWSEGWGGSDRLWHATIWPRIGAFLPADRVLEIAPGYGRVTHHLRRECRSLVVVDLVPECIEQCRRRFEDADNIEYHVNDGRSLAMLPDSSIDLALSWDSLVHAERDVIAAYLKELARVLKPGGTAFIHHSNVRAYRHRITRKLTVQNPHWRAESVSARIVREDAEGAGLACTAQELICWGAYEFNDCMSLLRRPSPGAPHRPTIVVTNHRFAIEVAQARCLAALYAPEPALVDVQSRIERDGHLGGAWHA